MDARLQYDLFLQNLIKKSVAAYITPKFITLTLFIKKIIKSLSTIYSWSGHRLLMDPIKLWKMIASSPQNGQFPNYKNPVQIQVQLRRSIQSGLIDIKVDVFLTKRKSDESVMNCGRVSVSLKHVSGRETCIGVTEGTDMCQSCCDYIIDHLKKNQKNAKHLLSPRLNQIHQSPSNHLQG